MTVPSIPFQNNQHQLPIAVIGLTGVSVFLRTDHFHEAGETIIVDQLHREPGGKGCNQAVAARRLGSEVIFLTSLGNDVAAVECQKFLREEAVETLSVFTNQASTAYADILTDKQGQNRVSVYRGAADYLTARDIYRFEAEFSRCGILLLNFECPDDVLMAAFDLARKYQLFTILNPAPAKDNGLAFAVQAALITPNEQEVCALLGMAPDELILSPDFFQQLENANLPDMVVTMGEKGALVCAEDALTRYQGLVVPTVDTTGAGDTFNAALAVALSEGGSLADAVSFAINASALSVTKPFVMNSLPVRAEVTAAYRDPVKERIR